MHEDAARGLPCTQLGLERAVGLIRVVEVDPALTSGARMAAHAGLGAARPKCVCVDRVVRPGLVRGGARRVDSRVEARHNGIGGTRTSQKRPAAEDEHGREGEEKEVSRHAQEKALKNSTHHFFTCARSGQAQPGVSGGAGRQNPRLVPKTRRNELTSSP
jgi:hypothetical protein